MPMAGLATAGKAACCGPFSRGSRCRRRYATTCAAAGSTPSAGAPCARVIRVCGVASPASRLGLVGRGVRGHSSHRAGVSGSRVRRVLARTIRRARACSASGRRRSPTMPSSVRCIGSVRDRLAGLSTGPPAESRRFGPASLDAIPTRWWRRASVTHGRIRFDNHVSGVPRPWKEDTGGPVQAGMFGAPDSSRATPSSRDMAAERHRIPPLKSIPPPVAPVASPFELRVAQPKGRSAGAPGQLRQGRRPRPISAPLSHCADRLSS